jgi:hypothetical protein
MDRAYLGMERIKRRLIGDLDPQEWDLPPKSPLRTTVLGHCRVSPRRLIACQMAYQVLNSYNSGGRRQYSRAEPRTVECKPHRLRAVLMPGSVLVQASWRKHPGCGRPTASHAKDLISDAPLSEQPPEWYHDDHGANWKSRIWSRRR